VRVTRGIRPKKKQAYPNRSNGIKDEDKRLVTTAHPVSMARTIHNN
jgi:hypothetical protein